MGNPHASLVIIGDSPDTADHEDHEPGGRTVSRLLRECGVDPQACWITHVSRYPVPRIPSRTFVERAQAVGIDLQREMDRLRNELETVQPNMIIALGQETCWTLTGKTDLESWRGSLVRTWGQRKCLSTYHPLRMDHERDSTYWKRQVLKLDLKRGMAEAETAELQVPRRTLAIARHAADVEAFFEETATDRLALDIEAHNGVPVCVGLATAPETGLTVPLWDLPDAGRVWHTLARHLWNPTLRKIGQHFKYDQPKLAALGLAIDRLDADTMLQAWTLQPELPCNLAFLASVYTREPFYKHEGMYESSQQALYEGCARDACVTCEVEAAQQKDIQERGLETYYRDFVMRLHPFYLDLEAEGFPLDRNRRDRVLAELIEDEARLECGLRQLTGREVNVESASQVRTVLERLQIPVQQGTSDDVLAGLMGHVIKDPYRQSVCAHLVEIRRLSHTIRDQVEALPDDDGALHTTYFVCTPDGCSRAGSQAPPVRPAVAVGTRQKAVGLAIPDLTDPRICAIVQPPAGECFLQLTLQDPRRQVVDHLAGLEADVEDNHVAAWIFGGDSETYRGSVWRTVAAHLREAFQHGFGARQTVVVVNTRLQRAHHAERISPRQVAEAFRILHQHQPQIRDVFHAQVLQCLETSRQLRTPLGGVRTFFGRWGPDLHRQAFAWLPARTVSEHTQQTGVRIRALHPWIQVSLERHDLLLVRVPVERHDEAAAILRTLAAVPIDFGPCSLERGPLSLAGVCTDGFTG